MSNYYTIRDLGLNYFDDDEIYDRYTKLADSTYDQAREERDQREYKYQNVNRQSTVDYRQRLEAKLSPREIRQWRRLLCLRWA